jgi:lipid II:glycine glycyltransferase (peptidoglycan interpeptide bridge formation enzyme)
MSFEKSQSIEDLVTQVKKLKRRLAEAQARNYELRYAGEPEPSLSDLKSKIERAQSDIDALLEQKKELLERLR